MTKADQPDTAEHDTTRSHPSGKALSPAARRALAEAEARRKASVEPEATPEIGGRGGADPVRFGDWEIGGRAIDF